MIADDSSDDIQKLIRLLRKAGVMNPVFEFQNGIEVVRFLRGVCEPDVRPTLRPCLVFLDLQMPGMSGLEVLAAIRNEPQFREMTVVLLPGTDNPQDVALAAEYGADRALPKFAAADEFKRIADSATQRHRIPAPALLARHAGPN